ncbi:hypothetical protein OAZ80_01925 [bacterium]|nr:hypothetical protein [bacterium]
MANIPVDSIDAEAASCLQYVALDAFNDEELTDHQEKQQRDDPRFSMISRPPPMVHQLGYKRFVVCVSSGLCLEFADRWDA